MNTWNECLGIVGIALVSLALFVGTKRLESNNEKLRRELALEAAKAKRRRNPIIKVGTIENGFLVGWTFYVWPGYHVIRQTCPVTGDLIIWGYSPEELHEIASRPSEFEQPDLAWFQREHD